MDTVELAATISFNRADHCNRSVAQADQRCVFDGRINHKRKSTAIFTTHKNQPKP